MKAAERVLDENMTQSGVTDPHLRTMAEVSGAHLRVGDTFPNKDVLAIRIAEEAIQVNALITVTRSDVVQYRAVGINFYAQANKNQIEGWVVNKIQVVEEMVIMMTRMRLIGMLTATTMEKWELCSEDVCMKYLWQHDPLRQATT